MPKLLKKWEDLIGLEAAHASSLVSREPLVHERANLATTTRLTTDGEYPAEASSQALLDILEFVLSR